MIVIFSSKMIYNFYFCKLLKEIIDEENEKYYIKEKWENIIFISILLFSLAGIQFLQSIPFYSLYDKNNIVQSFLPS